MLLPAGAFFDRVILPPHLGEAISRDHRRPLAGMWSSNPVGGNALKPLLVDTLRELIEPAGILERNDVKAR